MTRLALILTAILAISSPVFAQQSRNSQSPQPSAQLRVEPLPPLRVRPLPPLHAQPLPPLRWPGKFFAEPIPAWNIHGHAEVIPNLHARPLKTRSWRYPQPVPSLPRVGKTRSTATGVPLQAGNTTER
jgi:hypothetical protein